MDILHIYRSYLVGQTSAMHIRMHYPMFVLWYLHRFLQTHFLIMFFFLKNLNSFICLLSCVWCGICNDCIWIKYKLDINICKPNEWNYFVERVYSNITIDHCKKFWGLSNWKCCKNSSNAMFVPLPISFANINVCMCFSLWEMCWFMNDFCFHEW